MLHVVLFSYSRFRVHNREINSQGQFGGNSLPAVIAVYHNDAQSG